MVEDEDEADDLHDGAGAETIPRAYRDVRAEDTINVPAPTSISDKPKVCVLANLLGNMGKSTARIEMIVIKVLQPEQPGFDVNDVDEI